MINMEYMPRFSNRRQTPVFIAYLYVISFNVHDQLPKTMPHLSAHQYIFPIPNRIKLLSYAPTMTYIFT